MPYDPYADGYVIPPWYRPSNFQWPSGTISHETANLVGFLNSILPMMRTQQDMQSLATYISSIFPTEHFAGYATPTTPGPVKPIADPQYAWQAALGKIEHTPPGANIGQYDEANYALNRWLTGIWDVAGQYGMQPLAPGPTTATRGQQSQFQSTLGEMLQAGPSGSEAYAPWIYKLFEPTVTREVPGTYEYDPQSKRGYITKNPRFQ